MTTLESTRPYHRLSDVLKEDVDAALAGFRVYLSMFRRPARKPVAVAPPEPEPTLGAPNSQTGYNTIPGEVFAWLKANGEDICSHIARSIHRDESSIRKALKRMSERGEVDVRYDKNKILYRVVDGATFEPQLEQETAKRNTNARADVLALIAEHGPLTASEVAEHLGRASVWATNLLFRMRDDHALFVVGSKRNERNYPVQVYHTDPAYVYVLPEPPKPADPIIEAKRPARIPSIAAVDRGLALVAQHFHEEARGKAVFERLCVRPQSVPELEAALKMNDATVRLALSRMIQIGAVCKEEKEATFDRAGRRHVRQVYAVKEVQS